LPMLLLGLYLVWTAYRREGSEKATV